MINLHSKFKSNLLWALAIVAILFSINSPAADNPPKLKDVVSSPEDSAKTTTEQTPTETTEQKKLVKLGPDDEFDRGTPRTTIAGYFKAVKSADLERAANYLDLRNLPRGYSESDGPELARKLKVVLDRSLWVDTELLSTDPKGHSDDGLPSYRDLVGQIEVNNKSYDILLQRVPRGDGVYIWKLSSKTVRQVPRLYAAFGYGPVGEKLSIMFPEYEWLGLQIWQWVFLLLISLAAAVAAFPVLRFIGWFVKRRNTDLSLMFARFINGPVYFFSIIIITRQFFDHIHPSLTARAIFEGKTLLIIISAWLLIRFMGLFREYYSKRLREHDREYVIVLLRPALTTLNIIIVFVALLVWLDNIGFSVTTVLAGLGIGGIAIALATQKSIENFIGALTLYMAAPVKVGDFCRFGGNMGMVEEIGLRATKIRTLENTVVTIPNAEFAAIQIENLSERQRYRFNPLVPLQMDTTTKQLRYVLREFKKLLYAHNMIAEEPLRVRFIGFGEHSLDIEIHCYVETTNINIFKGVIEDLNLRMMEIINRAGTRIAMPAAIEYQSKLTQPEYMADHRLEEISSELSEEEIASIRNTISYPADSI
jgi:MscS family membrane protein